MEVIKGVKMEVKVDNTLFAKTLVHFNFLFNSPFNFLFLLPL